MQRNIRPSHPGSSLSWTIKVVVSNPHNFGEHFLWIFLRKIVNKFWLENSKINLHILIKKEYFTTKNLSLQVYLWKNKGLKIWNKSIINSVYTKKKLVQPILQLKPTQTFFNLIGCVFFNLKEYTGVTIFNQFIQQKEK